MATIDQEYDSAVGGHWVIREFNDATGPFKGKDYLLVQLAGGYYQSSRDNPLWIANVSVAPFPMHSAIPGLIMVQTLPYIISPFTNAMGATKNQPSSNIRLLDHSPTPFNATRSMSQSFGINVSGSLSTGTLGSVGASYNQSESKTVSDLEVNVQAFNATKHGATGVMWHSAFSRKDGMNVSTFSPRFDALFSFNKGFTGKIPLLIYEELVYWGDYADKAIAIPNTAAIGAASGAAAVGIATGGLLAPFGALGGAIVGALGGIPNDQKNSDIDKATHGDFGMLIGLVAKASQQGKVQRSARVLMLDTGEKKVTAAREFKQNTPTGSRGGPR